MLAGPVNPAAADSARPLHSAAAAWRELASYSSWSCSRNGEAATAPFKMNSILFPLLFLLD